MLRFVLRVALRLWRRVVGKRRDVEECLVGEEEEAWV
jgi:hypothetical protein